MMKKASIFFIITGQEPIIETPQKSYIMTWKMDKRHQV